MTVSVSFDFLPPPPRNAAGWPWFPPPKPPVTEGVGAMPRWPRVSIVTPSFNQASFLEKTIRSVLMQGYPNLEYLVIDGGSTDGSRAIIESYAPWLDYWVSEQDRGQSHAINKGLRRASGEILCWLNSDDYFLPGTLFTVGRLLGGPLREGFRAYAALVGHVQIIFDDDRTPIIATGRFQGRRRLLQFWRGYDMHQPAIFWRREVSESVGLLNENLHLTMDFDYWARMSKETDFLTVDRVLAVCHHHDAAKTGDGFWGYHRELRRRAWRYWGSPLRSDFWVLLWTMACEVYLAPILRRVIPWR